MYGKSSSSVLYFHHIKVIEFNDTQLTKSHDQMEALGYIYLVTSFLSIVGSGSIVIIIIIKKKVCNSEVRPIFHLSLADLIASVFLFVGAILFCVYTSKVSTEVMCSYLTALTSSWYMSTFLLTVMYAYEVYTKMKNSPVRRNTPAQEDVFGSFPQLYFLYSFSWILPLSITFCLFGIDSGEKGSGSLNDDICGTCLPVFHYRSLNCSIDAEKNDEPNWNVVYKFFFLALLFLSMLAIVIDAEKNDEPNWNVVYKFFFLALLFLSMLAIVVIYVMVLRVFHRMQQSGGIMGRQQYEQETRVRKWASLYQLVFISCWLPSFILGALSLHGDFNMDKYFALYVLQAAVSPLQGFFNCIIYGWRRHGFMRILRQRSLSWDTFS